MNEELRLREKLRKIEALFSGTNNHGEKFAASESIKRIKEKIQQLDKIEPSIEIKCSLPDRWSMQLFIALARRYGLKPYKYARQRRSSIMLKAPKSFIDNIFWPEYEALSAALNTYLEEITAKIIKEEIYKDIDDLQEIEPQKVLSR